MGELVLTFDNGPDTAATSQVLKSLAAHDCRAIFLPVGSKLDSPEGQHSLRAVAAEGHLIGNHTYSHPRLFGMLPASDAVAEIRRTQALLGDLASPERLFRPSAGGGHQVPGVLNQAVIDHLVAEKYTLVMWHVVCEDWCRPDGSWADMAFQQLDPTGSTVLVLHDVDAGGMAHLDGFLQRVLDAGIDVVTELPPDATPIVRGEIIGSVDHLLPGAPAGS